MFAVTAVGYRAVDESMPLSEGETLVNSVPQQLLDSLERADAVRRRNLALRACDWTQLAFSGLSEDEKSAWAIYREELVGLTQQQNFPFVDWPVPPA